MLTPNQIDGVVNDIHIFLNRYANKSPPEHPMDWNAYKKNIDYLCSKHRNKPTETLFNELLYGAAEYVGFLYRQPFKVEE